MSGDETSTAADAQRAFMEGQRRRERELGPAGLRKQADSINDGSAMGGVMARILRDRARDLEAEGDA